MSLYELASFLTKMFSSIIPKKKNRWVFGAWFGSAVSDNTKAISDYVELNCPDVEMIWITDNPSIIKLKHGKAMKRNTIKSLAYIMTSEVAFLNQGYGDLNALNFLGGCFSVQLWHGVAWKKIFKDTMNKPQNYLEIICDKIFDYVNSYALYISPSVKQSEIMTTAFNVDVSKILMCGQPRNEVLFSEDYRNSARNRLFEYIGGEYSKILLYMPTFRDNKNDIFSFGDDVVINKIQSFLKENDYVLIEKSHYASQKKSKKKVISRDRVIFMPFEQAEILLAASDMLITDYSSCFFDYLITDRPIIHYIYDYEYYSKKDRGLYYKKEDVLCGDSAETIDELFAVIVDNINNPDKEKDLRRRRREEYISFESENNSEVILKEVTIRKK